MLQFVELFLFGFHEQSEMSFTAEMEMFDKSTAPSSDESKEQQQHLQLPTNGGVKRAMVLQYS